MLRIPEDRGLFTRGTTVLLGLEPEPYRHAPSQINPMTSFSQSPEGWQLSQRVFIPVGGHPNRFGTSELFLRRLDQPTDLFRYSVGF